MSSWFLPAACRSCFQFPFHLDDALISTDNSLLNNQIFPGDYLRSVKGLGTEYTPPGMNLESILDLSSDNYITRKVDMPGFVVNIVIYFQHLIHPEGVLIVLKDTVTIGFMAPVGG